MNTAHQVTARPGVLLCGRADVRPRNAHWLTLRAASGPPWHRALRTRELGCVAGLWGSRWVAGLRAGRRRRRRVNAGQVRPLARRLRRRDPPECGRSPSPPLLTSGLRVGRIQVVPVLEKIRVRLAKGHPMPTRTTGATRAATACDSKGSGTPAEGVRLISAAAGCIHSRRVVAQQRRHRQGRVRHARPRDRQFLGQVIDGPVSTAGSAGPSSSDPPSGGGDQIRPRSALRSADRGRVVQALRQGWCLMSRTCMPAVVAAVTPSSVSSWARQRLGSAPSRRAARR